jgi:hypothetical protein
MADGRLGNAFMPETAEVFLGPLREGAEGAGRSLADIDLVAPVAVEFHDDDASAPAAARKHADGYAFTMAGPPELVHDERESSACLSVGSLANSCSVIYLAPQDLTTSTDCLWGPELDCAAMMNETPGCF